MDSDHILHPIKFKSMSSRLQNLTGGGTQLFSVSVLHGLVVLLAFSGAELEQTCTRPFSCISVEEGADSKITSIAITPDLGVCFLHDAGLGKTLRMEIGSGNCRVFDSQVSCKYS